MQRCILSWLFTVVAVLSLSACGSSAPAPAASANANLANALLSEGTLDQAISQDVTDYSATVPSSVSSITLTPSLQDTNASVKVNGSPVTSGHSSQEIPLNVGDNYISVDVTAADGSTRKIYSFIITRGSSDNARLSALSLSTGPVDNFLPTQLSYNLSVEKQIDKITVTATPEDMGASLIVNGEIVEGGTASPVINLVEGATKTISVEVTAQDGFTTQIYTLYVTRDSGTNTGGPSGNLNLTSLAVSTGTFSPAFSPAHTSYDMTVANAVSSLQITATLESLSSTLMVDGALTASGNTSSPLTLATGSNTFDIVVTGLDSSTRTYRLNVLREPSTVATLSSLAFSQGSLVPAFDSSVLNYTMSVGYSVNSLTVTPTLSDSTAVMSINNSATANGVGTVVNLGVGNNPVTIAVTAEDATTVKEYRIAVTRESGDNAKLGSLTLSSGALNPPFDPNVTSYTAEVADSVTSISLTPTTLASGASLKINNTSVLSGFSFGPASLAGGPNAFVFDVTAENAVDTQSYTLTVNRLRNAPVFTSGNQYQMDEDQTTVGSVTATHDLGQTVTYSIVGGVDSPLLSIDANSGALSFNAAPDWAAPADNNSDNFYELTVRASATVSSTVYTSDLPITVEVLEVNLPPTITSSNSVGLAENIAAATTVTATDPEGKTLTYGVTAANDGNLFTIDANSGVLSFKNAADFENPTDANADNVYLVEVSVSDGVNTVTDTVTITIGNVDDAPLFTSIDAVNVNENTTAVLTVSATDQEGATVTYSITGGADQSLFAIDTNTGDLTFNSAPDYETPLDGGGDNIHFVTVTADDGTMTRDQTLTVTVVDVNEVPTITSSNSASINENNRNVLTVAASDPDNDTLIYSISGGVDAALFTINASSGQLKFISAPNYELPADSDAMNDYVVEVTAFDGVYSDVQTVTVTINDLFDNFSMNITNTDMKTLTFSWSPYSTATFYRLYEDPDGASGWTQVGNDIAGTSMTLELATHLTNWSSARYILEAFDSAGSLGDTASMSISSNMIDAIGFLKAYNGETLDYYGTSVDMSDDGSVMVIGAPDEDTYAPGANSTNVDNNTGTDIGAAYVYRKTGGSWTFDALLKPSTTVTGDSAFGDSVSISGDGSTIVVGAPGHDRAGTGINPPDSGTSTDSGAVFVYRHDGSAWATEAYIKSAYAEASDYFGTVVDVSDDGNTLAVGAPGEDGGGAGVGGDQTSNSGTNSGAVFVFYFDGSNWSQQSYIKSMFAAAWGSFGSNRFSLSGDGNTLAVGSASENGSIGLAHIYINSGGTWSHEAYVTPSYAQEANGSVGFGSSLALSDDGNLMLVGAYGEDANTTGIRTSPVSGSFGSDYERGAAYLYSRSGHLWNELYYIKASNSSDYFGYNVAMSDDGSVMAIGSPRDTSFNAGINTSPIYSKTLTGSAYVFSYIDGTLTQKSFVKMKESPATNGDFYGWSIALDGTGNTLIVGSHKEDSCGTTFNVAADDGCLEQGAVYLY